MGRQVLLADVKVLVGGFLVLPTDVAAAAAVGEAALAFAGVGCALGSTT